MPVDLQYLNENQRAAVEWSSGPLLVLAGPGSGKTLVLTLRIARLLESTPTQRFRILGLTFTNKAAAEMRDRLEQLVAIAADRALLTTFHAFAADVLRQHGSHMGLAPDFTILNEEEDRVEVLRDAIACLNNAGSDIEESDIKLLPIVTDLLEKLVPEDSVETSIRNPELGHKVALLYSAYRKQLVTHKTLDFPSLIAFAYELLTKYTAIARHYRTIYKHVCVDEFQDTNLAQYRFLAAIAGPDPANLFVVADDDQIVYQWNGANPERLAELREHFRMAVIQLPQNYRCPDAIVDIANKLIRNNATHSPQKLPLTGVKRNGHSKHIITLKSLPSPEAEVQWIAKHLAKLAPEELGSCVILARTRALVERAATALQECGIPYTLAIKKSEFVSAPFRWLHGMLRLANARGDREQLRRICKAFYELEGISVRVQDIVAASAATGGDYLRSWMEHVLARAGLATETRTLLKTASDQLMDRLQYRPFVEFALRWFDGIEADGPENAEGFNDYREEKVVWKDLFERILRKYGSADVSLNVLLQELDLSPKQTMAPPNAVRCYTIHTAKGMEFDHVCLMGLAEDILPSFQSIKRGDQSLELQEERRSCFVAITRTRKDLVLTYSHTYFGYSKKPSRFLREMGLL